MVFRLVPDVTISPGTRVMVLLVVVLPDVTTAEPEASRKPGAEALMV